VVSFFNGDERSENGQRENYLEAIEDAYGQHKEDQMSFRIHALPQTQFADLFSIPEQDLAAHRAIRRTTDAKPGFPCRVSLTDAEIGETVLLAHFIHQDAETPYRASHAVYVREGVTQAFPEPGEVPDFFAGRLISLRAFDTSHMMTGADVIEGDQLEGAITRMLSDPHVEYLHLHNAKPGCYLARVTRD
jgi:hypothetical protein